MVKSFPHEESDRVKGPVIDPKRVLVLVPTLNEATHIEAVLRDLVKGDPIAALCPIVVADGGSTDGTSDIVRRMAGKWPNLRILNNRGRTQAAAMNMLLADEFSEIDYVVRCDAHARYPAGFVQGLVTCLLERDAGSVVIAMDAEADTEVCFQRGLVWIADTAIGAGGSPHRGGVTSGYCDHGHHAAFRMSTFRKLGGYDTSFIANEDAEYDRRLIQSGERIWLSAEHRIGYYPRTSLGKLWKQYYRYGIGRAQTCLKHSVRPSLRQVIPAVNTVLLVASLFVIPFSHWGLVWPIIYGSLILAAGVWMTLRYRAVCGFAATPALATMHLAWGLGFLGRMVKGRQDALALVVAGAKD